MAMVVGAEVRLEPLLRRTLQRLLYHTSFPVGLVLLAPERREGGQVEAQLAAAIGDWKLVGRTGGPLTVPAALVEGEAALLDAPALLAEVPGLARRHAACLRLPIEGQGVILLLAPQAPGAQLPLASVFQPVMANLARAIVLCRSHEAHTRALTSERDLSQAQLRQAQKLESLARLTGGVAHDFNNLLTAILGGVDALLESTPAGDPRLEEVREIETAARRAATLTRQLLVFSRKSAIELVEVDLSASVAGMVRLLSRLIGEDVELVTRPGAGPARVLADAGQVEQVILNLAVNGRDAMPHGGRLTVETSAGEVRPEEVAAYPGAQPGPHVVLSVADTGVGMAAEVQAHLFEPFFTTKEAGKGTGLGLSTVFGIVQRAGGHLRVESAPGQGSRFEVWLPAVAPGAAAAAQVEAPALARAGPASGTVLLAEDDPAVRALAARTLRRAGFRVLEAADGAQALALADQPGGFDLLLTDLVMPNLGGGALALRLRERRPALPVLYMTGYTELGPPAEPGGQPGRCLQKPFTPPALLRAARQALAAGPAAPPARPA